MKIALRLFTLLTILVGGCIFFAQHTQAATLNVVAGTDGIEDDSQCRLSEAIQNINDQAQTNTDCPAGDGNNDTANLPSGTITLSVDLPTIQQSVVIQGQGMDETIIDSNDLSGIRSLAGTLRVYDLKITQFSYEAIRAQALSNLIVERIEISYGSSPQGSSLEGIDFSTPYQDIPPARTLTVRDVYIHDLSSSGNSNNGILVVSSDGALTTATIENVTIRSLSGTGVSAVTSGIAMSTFKGVPSAGTVNASISNVTINDIVSADDGATGVNSFATTANGNSQVNVDALNLTIFDVSGAASQVWGGESGGLITAAGIALQTGDVAGVNIDIKNSLLIGDNSPSCIDTNVGTLFGGVGEFIPSITSLGGNLSDDESCNDYFDQETDQNNVSNLALTLGPLSDNGGLVPTISLLPGSPAIDAGVTVSGLTTDARGVTRPQCATFDSGAYEYNGICPTTSSQTLTYPDPAKGSTVTLILPEDVTNPSVAPVDYASLLKDGDNQFPAGLTSFQFTTTPGATKTVTLYYDLPGDPADYTARKYKTSTQSYLDVPNATITREDYNGKSMLKLTYSITDGGILDQDGQANGTVIDPVGLASTSLADTGESQRVWLVVIGISFLVGLYVLTRWRSLRNHKA